MWGQQWIVRRSHQHKITKQCAMKERENDGASLYYVRVHLVISLTAQPHLDIRPSNGCVWCYSIPRYGNMPYRAVLSHMCDADACIIGTSRKYRPIETTRLHARDWISESTKGCFEQNPGSIRRSSAQKRQERQPKTDHFIAIPADAMVEMQGGSE